MPILHFQKKSVDVVVVVLVDTLVLRFYHSLLLLPPPSRVVVALWFPAVESRDRRTEDVVATAQNRKRI